MDPIELAQKLLAVLEGVDNTTASTAMNLAETLRSHQKAVRHDAWMKENSPATEI